MNTDRVKQELESFIEHVIGRRLLFAYLWEAKVVTFNATTQETELLIDDERMKGTGMSRITMRHGMPGVEATLKVNDRVHLGFSGGDPDKPFILGYGEATDGTEERIARETDSVHGGTVTAIDSVTGPVTFIYTPFGGTPGVPLTTLTLSGGEITSGSNRSKLED